MGLPCNLKGVGGPEVFMLAFWASVSSFANSSPSNRLLLSHLWSAGAGGGGPDAAP